MITRRAAFGALVGAAVLGAVACDDSSSHIYSGREYEQARGCLDDVSSIDVVSGPEPETPCAPICIVGQGDDAVASLVYVSTMCPPLPQVPYDTTGTDPRCATALALYNANTTCLADGGIANLADAASPGDIDAGTPDTGSVGAPDAGVDATINDSGADATLDDSGSDASDGASPATDATTE